MQTGVSQSGAAFSCAQGRGRCQDTNVNYALSVEPARHPWNADQIEHLRAVGHTPSGVRVRLGYQDRRLVLTAGVALADWRITSDGGAWHITFPRRGGGPFTLPAVPLPAAWASLADDQETRNDPDAPRRLVEVLRALESNHQEETP